jgi:hypothetical protein
MLGIVNTSISVPLNAKLTHGQRPASKTRSTKHRDFHLAGVWWGRESIGVAVDGANVNDSEASLQSICGARLTSVQFVLDYLILGFDGKGALTTLVWPEISSSNTVVRFGMSGYRDHLCELITQVVGTVEMGEDETILIAFVNGSSMRIPLRSRKAPGERAIFTAPNHQLRVW